MGVVSKFLSDRLRTIACGIAGDMSRPEEGLAAALAGINHAAFGYYPRFQRVKSFVVSHISQHVSLREAAQLAAYEPTYFCDLFHRRVGIPFSKWLTMTRVSKAA